LAQRHLRGALAPLHSCRPSQSSIKMRAVLMLGAIAIASAADTAKCAIDGSGAMDSAANAALNIWASTKRCDKGAASDAMCAVDIASSIHSVNDMVMTIVSAVEDCGAIKTSHYKCGMAVGGLTSASAALAAATAGVLARCPTSLKQDYKNAGLDEATYLGKCVVDAKSSMTSLFSASHKLASVNAATEKDDAALNVVAALADLGHFLAGAVNQCSLFKGAGDETAACAAHSLGLVSALNHMADAGINIADKCEVTKEQRLYLQNGAAAAPTGSSMPLALAFLLPISAVLSFVAGSRFAKARAQSVRETDCEQLMQEE